MEESHTNFTSLTLSKEEGNEGKERGGRREVEKEGYIKRMVRGSIGNAAVHINASPMPRGIICRVG